MTRSGRHGASRRSDRPVAAVYRGSVACEGCAESVADLLRSSPLRYRVHYLGPDEVHDISAPLLSHLDLFAWPGGGDDVEEDFEKVKQYKEAIQGYIASGGKYLGICMGAFLARGEDDELFGLLPEGSYVSSERFESGAEVKSAEDTIIRVDWTWHAGVNRDQTSHEQWMYFQDGAVMKMTPGAVQASNILGRYSATQNINSIILPFGKGHVGLIGTHPEADQSWYDDYNITNPQNVSFATGFDFVQALHDAGNPDNVTSAPTPAALQAQIADAAKPNTFYGLHVALFAVLIHAAQHLRRML